MSYGTAPWNRLRELLENYPSTADDVDAIVRIIREEYPVLPTSKIIYPGGVWPLDKPHYIHKPHLTDEPESFEIALGNIAKTGKTLNSSEHIFLRYILDAPFAGWSGTLSTHHDDAWMQYLRNRFSLLDLVPILDDMTWSEEVAMLPLGYNVTGPEFALLSDRTNFYFYEFDADGLWKAGTMIEDVFEGMKKRKWWYDTKDRWEEVEGNEEEYDRFNYFPNWMRERQKDGSLGGHVLIDPLYPFVPHSRAGVDAGAPW